MTILLARRILRGIYRLKCDKATGRIRTGAVGHRSRVLPVRPSQEEDHVGGEGEFPLREDHVCSAPLGCVRAGFGKGADMAQEAFRSIAEVGFRRGQLLGLKF